VGQKTIDFGGERESLEVVRAERSTKNEDARLNNGAVAG